MRGNFGLKLQNSPKLPHIHARFYRSANEQSSPRNGLIRNCLDLFSAVLSSARFLIKMRKISRCRPRCPKYPELSHFTLLFCRGRQRNAQKFITHVRSLFYLFSMVAFSLSSGSLAFFNCGRNAGQALVTSKFARHHVTLVSGSKYLGPVVRKRDQR